MENTGKDAFEAHEEGLEKENTEISIDEIVAENLRRNAALQVSYDPISGMGACGKRQKCVTPDGEAFLPVEMLEKEPNATTESCINYRKSRIKYDFEFWCATCATIRDKTTGRDVKFRLNAPQRRVLAELESQRKRGEGIRMVLLKARQWGGSTLVLMYMAWIQLVLQRNWNSLICGHKKGTANAIKAMYTRLLRHYPEAMLDDGVQLQFRNFEDFRSAKTIEGRDCLVILTSAYCDDAVRGFDISMAHLSEVAFWPSTPSHDPEDLMRSIDGSIMIGALTLEVLESTANGMGSFFHTEWLNASSGMSDKTAIFVPWYEIEIYRLPVDDAEALWNSLDDYERNLWDEGCTLEMINWYHKKRRGYASHHKMMSEFPSNAIEAFVNSGKSVFALDDLELLRQNCSSPAEVGNFEGQEGELKGSFVAHPTGQMKCWKKPEKGDNIMCRYVVSVDVGGRSDSADYSVISVIDRKNLPDEKMEVVAQWRGHIDHDLLAWKAAQIARAYDNALLIFESNTFETGDEEGGNVDYILDQIASRYGNTYSRTVAKNGTKRRGFQTNRKTKMQLVNNLIAMVREQQYVEHDHEAVDEMSWFEHQPNGRFGAAKGRHDDIVMSRGIGLFVARTLPHRPRNDWDPLFEEYGIDRNTSIAFDFHDDDQARKCIEELRKVQCLT